LQTLLRGIGGGAENSRGDHPAASLGLIGGTRGCARALPVHGLMIGAADGGTFREIVSAFRTTPPLILNRSDFRRAHGACGVMLPAWQAARQALALAV